MSLRGAPANSTNVVAGLTLEDPDCLGVYDPAGETFWIQRVGPTTAQPMAALIETGVADGSGQMAPPVLGAMTAPFDLGSGADPRFMDRLFQVATRGNLDSSTLIDAGLQIYRRTWSYDPSLPELAWTGDFAIQDIDPRQIWRIHGMHMAGFTVTAAAGSFASVRFTGEGVSYSRYSPAGPGGPPPFGTHAGPQIRGISKTALANELVFVKVTNVGDPNTPAFGLPYTPLQFQIETVPDGGGFPTWTGITYYQEYFQQPDGSYLATWRDALDADGYDIGTVTEQGSKAPVQVLFPGTLTDTAAEVVVGDTWAFNPVDIPALTPVLDDEQLFTLAHIRMFIEDPDTGDIEEFLRDDLTMTFAHPLQVVHGDSSNFVTRIDRTADQMLSLTSTTGVTSPKFHDARLRDKRWHVKVVAEGAQWDGVPSVTNNEPAPRRSFEVYMPNSSLIDATQSIDSAATITQAIGFRSSQGWTFTATDEF